MTTIARYLRLSCLVVVLASCPLAGGMSGQDGKLQEKLIGSWRLESGKYGGQVFEFPAGSVTLKHVTPAQFMWVTHDKDGLVTRAAGGSYTLKDATYEELPEYGVGPDFQIIKARPQTFHCKIEGDTWYHDGKLSNGQSIEEVWKRVPKK
jgi:hypothetical protein